MSSTITKLVLAAAIALLAHVPVHAQSDDFTADVNTEGQVEVNASTEEEMTTGEIETARDKDWFAVDLVADHTYTFDVEGADTEAGTLGDPIILRLRDSEGEKIPDTRKRFGGEGRNARLTYTAEQTDTHYIVVRGRYSATGTYTVSVTDSTASEAEYDLGDITDLAGSQSRNGSVGGEGGAVDYYRFMLNGERDVVFELVLQGRNSDLFIEDSEGSILFSSSERRVSDERIEETLSSGTYYVRVEAQGSRERNYTLRYSVAGQDAQSRKSVPSKEPEPSIVEKQVTLTNPPSTDADKSSDVSKDTSTTGVLAVGAQVTGYLNRNSDERDWYRVTLVKNQIYVFSLDIVEGRYKGAVIEGIYKNSDNMVRVGGRSGENISSGTQSLYFRPTRDGTYYVSLWYEAGERNQISYKLVLLEDDYGGGVPRTTLSGAPLGTLGIGSGNGVSGKIGHIVDDENYIDIDSFAIKFESGKQYRITVSGTGSDGLRNPSLRLHGGRSYGIEGGRQCGTTVKPSSSGTVVLEYRPRHPTLEQIRRGLKQPRLQAASGMYSINVSSKRSCMTRPASTEGCSGWAGGRCNFPLNPNMRRDCLGSYDLTVEEVTPTTLSETLCTRYGWPSWVPQ